MKKYTETEIDRVRKELAKYIRMRRNTVKACRWSQLLIEEYEIESLKNMENKK